MEGQCRHTSSESVLRARRDKQFYNGVRLVIVAFALLAPVIDRPWFVLLFVLVLGLICIAWGVVSERSGPIVPGSVLFSLGWGITVIHQSSGALTATEEAGILLFALGTGLLLITYLTVWYTSEPMGWWLPAGAVLTLIGVELLIGSHSVNTVNRHNRLWMSLLVACGLYVFWQHLRRV